MAQVLVTLNGRSYRLLCGDGEEARIKELAAFVRERIDDLSIELGQPGDDRLLVIAALMITDELWETQEQLRAVSKGAAAHEPDEAPDRTPAAPVPVAPAPAPPETPPAARVEPDPAAHDLPPPAVAARAAAPGVPKEIPKDGPKDVPQADPGDLADPGAGGSEPSLKRAMRRMQARATLAERVADAGGAPPTPGKGKG